MLHRKLTKAQRENGLLEGHHYLMHCYRVIGGVCVCVCISNVFHSDIRKEENTDKTNALKWRRLGKSILVIMTRQYNDTPQSQTSHKDVPVKSRYSSQAGMGFLKCV